MLTEEESDLITSLFMSISSVTVSEILCPFSGTPPPAFTSEFLYPQDSHEFDITMTSPKKGMLVTNILVSASAPHAEQDPGKVITSSGEVYFPISLATLFSSPRATEEPGPTIPLEFGPWYGSSGLISGSSSSTFKPIFLLISFVLSK